MYSKVNQIVQNLQIYGQVKYDEDIFVQTLLIVCGVVYFRDFYCYGLILLAILHVQTLPYQNQVVAIFFSCKYGCHFEFENGRFIQGSKNELTPINLKSMPSCSSDHKDSKNV